MQGFLKLDLTCSYVIAIGFMVLQSLVSQQSIATHRALSPGARFSASILNPLTLQHLERRFSARPHHNLNNMFFFFQIANRMSGYASEKSRRIGKIGHEDLPKTMPNFVAMLLYACATSMLL